MEINEVYTNKRYGKGSTGDQSAFPPQISDGRSGGVPRKMNAPSLRKPAVLVTSLPEPLQGTPGTAISALLQYPGPALPRQQRGGGGAKPPGAADRKTGNQRINLKLVWRHTQIERKYVMLICKHVALIVMLSFKYVRLIMFTIGLLRGMLFCKPALPYVVIHASAHNRRGALFRRRAVRCGFRMFPPLQIPRASAAWSAGDRPMKNFSTKT